MRQILAVQLFFGMTFRAGRSSKVAVALILALSLGEMASLTLASTPQPATIHWQHWSDSDQLPSGVVVRKRRSAWARATKENSAFFCQNSFAKQTTIYRIGHSRTSKGSYQNPFFSSEAATTFHFSSRFYRLATTDVPV